MNDHRKCKAMANALAFKAGTNDLQSAIERALKYLDNLDGLECFSVRVPGHGDLTQIASAYLKEHDPTPVTEAWFREEIGLIESHGITAASFHSKPFWLDYHEGTVEVVLDIEKPDGEEDVYDIFATFKTRGEVRTAMRLFGMEKKTDE